MNRDEKETFFASAERSDTKELHEQIRLVIHDPIVKVILQAVKGYAMILNGHRQIIAANQELLHALNLTENTAISERPGELLHCEHCQTAPSGCGTGYNCQSCGAALAIVAAQVENKTVNEECRMLINKNGEIECIDFQVQASPFLCGDNKMVILVLQDVSKARRKDVLEKVFLHDLNNTLGALMGYCSLLKQKDSSRQAYQILKIAERLKDEIDFQQLLILAENRTLSLNPVKIKVSEITNKLKEIFQEHASAADRFIFYQTPDNDISLTTDPVLLNKILVNMIKNGLEATEKGGQIEFFCEIQPDWIGFCVHSHAEIPEITALNIFHRSFSTKPGNGRGIGTYSMKLFGENYLQGRVGFTTGADKGTVFYIQLPYTAKICNQSSSLSR